jgi:hypothetical protein
LFIGELAASHLHLDKDSHGKAFDPDGKIRMPTSYRARFIAARIDVVEQAIALVAFKDIEKNLLLCLFDLAGEPGFSFALRGQLPGLILGRQATSDVGGQQCAI